MLGTADYQKGKIGSDMNKLYEQLSGQIKTADTEKILLVEDNEVNTEVAVDMLEILGFTVDRARNGQEALNLYDKNQYILIFMDCEMPVMNGFDAATQIRKVERELQHIPTPIIALTAHALPGVREKCIASGMNDFLSKPFGIDDLDSMLNKWLATSPAEPSERSVYCGSNIVTNDDSNELIILDYEVLDKHRKRQNKGGLNLVNRIIDIYLEQSSGLLVELMDAAQRADVEAVRKISHALKSSSLNVGAMRLSGLCREVELICESGKIDNSLVKKIYATFTDVEKALNNVLDNVNKR